MAASLAAFASSAFARLAPRRDPAARASRRSPVASASHRRDDDARVARPTRDPTADLPPATATVKTTPSRHPPWRSSPPPP